MCLSKPYLYGSGLYKHNGSSDMLIQHNSNIAGFNFVYADVTHWSDVVFVEWQSQAEDEGLVRELNYVFRQAMANFDTAAGLAMLGTPNGCGVAWLLATHKEQFSKRTIQSVRVWADDAGYNAYFKIVPLGG